MDPIESFDALTVGQEFDFGRLVMTRAEILDFGQRFDPQPMHVDEAAAAEGPFGRLYRQRAEESSRPASR